jgi:Xaa-Pro aminopeptidase
MIPARDYQERIEAVRQIARERGLDAVLAAAVFPEKEGHVACLTGYRIWTPQWPTGSGFSGVGYSFVLITQDTAELFATRLDAAIRASSHVTAFASDNLLDAVGERVGRFGPAVRLGVAGLDILPSSLGPHLPPPSQIVDLDRDLFALRLRKSPGEQQVLADGAALATKAIGAAQARTRVGITNRDVAAAAVGEALRLGADHVLRCRIRSGDETGTVCWPYADDRVMAAGDFVQIDLVGIFKNYLFDVSRVWVAGGATSKQSDTIGSACGLTTSLIDVLEPGSSIADAIGSWQQRITVPAGYKANLDGHSIGLDVVEPPWISASEPLELDDGMVFCVEPFLSSASGEALKVEETILIKRGGNVVLSCP